MRAQEKNIKGFNVLELIAVVLIIGIISAAAYPKFSGWKTQREIRDAALKIKSLMLDVPVKRSPVNLTKRKIAALNFQENSLWEDFQSLKAQKVLYQII